MDPCETADPDAHFEFSESGKIKGLTEAGKRTIRELKLHRDDLERQREEAWLTFRDSINLAIASGEAARVRLPKVPTYLAVRRAVVRDMRQKSAVPQFFDQLVQLLAQL